MNFVISCDFQALKPAALNTSVVNDCRKKVLKLLGLGKWLVSCAAPTKIKIVYI